MSRIIPRSIKLDEEIMPFLKKYKGSFNSLIAQLLWLWVNDPDVRAKIQARDDRYHPDDQPAHIRRAARSTPEPEITAETVTQPLVHIVDEPVEKPSELDEILPK